VAEALELAERAGDHALQAHATIMGLLLLESTDPKRRSEALATVAELSRVLEALGDELGLARAQRLLGDIHWAHCHYADVDLALERALEHARRAGATWEEASILAQYTGSGVYGPAPTHEAARRCEDVLARFGGMGLVEARALRALASIRAMEGRFDEARELATRARATLEELGTRLRAAFVSDTLGFIETMAGDFAAAERELRAGYDTVVELGERGFQATIAAELAHALVAQGKLEDGEVLSRLSEDLCAEDDVASQVMWRSARARIFAARGLLEDAETLARDAVARADETDDVNMRAETLVAFAEVLSAAGRGADATEALAGARLLFEGKGNVAGADAIARRLASLDAAR
jgi:tetratricopeptide (TPR) repeat protein